MKPDVPRQGKSGRLASASGEYERMSVHVVIVGGGLAGLAAAVGLAGRTGIRVTLCESRLRWGGRASSFIDQTTGELIDNCQHVTLGCCTNFADFCRWSGIADIDTFKELRRLTFVGPDGRVSHFFASRLPAPFHLAISFSRLKFLSLREKFQLARGLRALARTQPENSDGETMLHWLKRHGQTQNVINRFWHVVLVSALSETLERISVRYARKVFVDTFLANRRGWEVSIPNVPLAKLYGANLDDWFANRYHNINARLQTGIKRVIAGDCAESPEAVHPTDLFGATVAGVELRSGERIEADHVILAIPQNLVVSLLPESWRSYREFAAISQMETAPISSAHLWFDRPITDLDHAVFVGRLSQWLFNHGRELTLRERMNAIQEFPPEGIGARPLVEERTAGPLRRACYYQVVISASRDVLERGQEETIRDVVEELAGVWPVVRDARLIHSRLVTEHKAVISMLPGVDKLRPVQQSPIENLQLAGDWTQTGWPGTMEGAVRSGYLAAENVLKKCGINVSLVQPDLPVARLSKLLFGL
jgi:squalene-associated FAD-dependent desaturase